MYCSKCGKEIGENNRFCGYCGEEIINNNSLQNNKDGEEEILSKIKKEIKEKVAKKTKEVLYVDEIKEKAGQVRENNLFKKLKGMLTIKNIIISAIVIVIIILGIKIYNAIDEAYKRQEYLDKERERITYVLSESDMSYDYNFYLREMRDYKLSVNDWIYGSIEVDGLGKVRESEFYIQMEYLPLDYRVNKVYTTAEGYDSWGSNWDAEGDGGYHRFVATYDQSINTTILESASLGFGITPLDEDEIGIKIVEIPNLEFKLQLYNKKDEELRSGDYITINLENMKFSRE